MNLEAHKNVSGYKNFEKLHTYKQLTAIENMLRCRLEFRLVKKP